MSNSDDAPLIAILDELSSKARANLTHHDKQRLYGVWFGQPPHPWHELVEIVVSILVSHPEFGQAASCAFGPKQLLLHPTWLGNAAMVYAGHHGGQKTVEWLRRLMAFQGPTSLRYYAEVYGLRIDAKVTLSNGVTLIPLDELPTTDNAEAVKAQWIVRPVGNFRMEQAIGAYLQRDNIVRGKQPNADHQSDVLEKTIRAFTLVDKMAPVIGTTWVEHTDPDLYAAEVGRVFGQGMMEGRLPSIGEPVDGYAVAWVEEYLALPESVRERLDLAIARLNLGRRRLFPGDQAIEAGICLETLLGDPNEATDMTYKLRLRTARVLEEEFEARRALRKAVNDLYKLRSKTVHGAAYREEREARRVARDGLDIAARLLQKTVRNGDLFDTDKIDLEN